MNCTPIKTIYINSMTTTATGVILIPSKTINDSDLVNLNKYKMIIACNLKATSDLPIYIQTASGNVPLLCRYASNSIFPDQLRNRYCYTLVYGNNSVVSKSHFVLQNCVCSTSATVSTATTTSTDTTTTKSSK